MTGKDLYAEHQLKVLEPPLAKLLERATSLWKQYHPVEASLWGEPQWDAAEDLSEQGLANWKEVLVSLQSDSAGLDTRAFSPLEQAIQGELQRFIHEQMLRHVHQAVYQTKASSYLQLCAFALLPFYLQQQVESTLNLSMLEALESRLGNCIKWLKCGEQRLQAGTLTYTEVDRQVSVYLYQTLAESSYRSLPPVAGLLEQIANWMRIPSQHPARPPFKASLSWYLETILEVRSSFPHLLAVVSERLQQEVEALSRFVSESKVTAARNADAVHPDDMTSRLAWVRQVEIELRRRVVGAVLDSVGPQAHLIQVPRTLEPFITGAMYLPPSITGQSAEARGWLMLQLKPSSNPCSYTPVPPSASGLALVVAHELCPGHGEHLRRASQSSLASLYEMTRSHTGLEGWAFLAEEAIVNLQDFVPFAARAVQFQRVRRFATTVRLLAKVHGDPENAKNTLTKLLAPLPESEQRKLLEIQSGQDLELLAYTLGFIETESALVKVARKLGKQPLDSTTNEAYLQCGPLAPQRVVSLVNAT